jgi:hypothetical protein
MDVPLAVIATFVICGAFGAVVIWIVSRIKRAELRPGNFVGAFLVAAILGVAVVAIIFLKLVQDGLNANF